MKKIFFAMCMMAIVITACTDEGRLDVPPEQPAYNLEDDPNDPVQHFIYETYRDLGVIVIVNPTIADYRFNFTSYNGIDITAPPQDPEILQAGVELLKETVLELYDDEFLKKNLPVNLILCDRINMASFGETYEMDSYAAANFLAISHVNAATAEMTAEQRNALKIDANTKLWGTYMSSILKTFTAPDSFYQAGIDEFGDKYYEYYWGEDPAEIDFHQYGFISYDVEASWIEPDWGWYDVYGPDKALDLLQWFGYILGTPKAEIEADCAKYPIMKTKYDALAEAMGAAGYRP